jgi:hypothetical protein
MIALIASASGTCSRSESLKRCAISFRPLLGTRWPAHRLPALQHSHISLATSAPPCCLDRLPLCLDFCCQHVPSDLMATICGISPHHSFPRVSALPCRLSAGSLRTWLRILPPADSSQPVPTALWHHRVLLLVQEKRFCSEMCARRRDPTRCRVEGLATKSLIYIEISHVVVSDSC